MALIPTTDFDKLREGAKRFASGFTPGQKVVSLLAVVLAVGGGLIFMSMAGKPTYAPLFTNLSPSDAASITAKLSSDKVPYQLSDGGQVIMVPANEVDQERLALAQAGLPASGTVGLSLLDKEGITASSMTQQADYLQAIQGELEQTIDSINGVSASQVNVALPANQNFALNSNKPTGASVMVTTKPGVTLSSAQVQAIVHLVGSSVPNLSASQVTVADSNGNMLAGPGVAQGGASADAATQSYDAATQAKVESYLGSVLGQGNADVEVNANLDYSQVSTTTQSILAGPNGQPASFCTQTSKSSQSYTGTGTPPGGAAGSVTAPTGNGTGTYTQSQTSQTCETSEQTKHVQQAPGTIQSQSVAVLVNSRSLPKGVNLAALKAGVAAAAGINPARGDQLAFSTMPFNNSAARAEAAQAAAASAAQRSRTLDNLVRTAAVALVIGLVLLLLWRSARRGRAAAGTSVLSPLEMAALQVGRRSETPNAELAPAARGQIAASQEAADVNSFIDNQADDVAAMLRSWLVERQAPVS